MLNAHQQQPEAHGHHVARTQSQEDRQIEAAVAASRDSHAAELAASRARIAADMARLQPQRITQLVQQHWEARGEAMPAADLKRAFDAAWSEELPLAPGQTVKDLLRSVAELEVFSPPGRTHLRVRLREQPPPHRRRAPPRILQLVQAHERGTAGRTCRRRPSRPPTSRPSASRCR
jgi:hypothetical protein